MLGHRGTAKAAQLRKDKPHPVGPLPAGPQLAQYGIKNRLLRRHEPFEIEGVRHLSAPHSTVAQDAVMSRFLSAISIQAGA